MNGPLELTRNQVTFVGELAVTMALSKEPTTVTLNQNNLHIFNVKMMIIDEKQHIKNNYQTTLYYKFTLS